MKIRTAIYRAFGSDDDLLYVGISKDFGRRWRQHAATKPWWPEVRRLTVVWHPDEESASTAETEAIACEKPRHNIAKVPRLHCSVYVPERVIRPELLACARQIAYSVHGDDLLQFTLDDARMLGLLDRS